MDIMDLLTQARPDSLDSRPDPARRASDLARAVATPRDGTAARPGASPRRLGGVRAHPVRLLAIGTSMAALAGTAGAVIALNATGTTAARQQRAAAHAGTTVPTPGELQNGILTAFNGVSGDISYIRITQTYTGTMSKWNAVSENWSYPLHPQAGQDVRKRSLVLPFSSPNKSDTEWLYTEPAGTSSGSGPLAMISAKTEMVDVQYGNRTWSDTTSNESFLASRMGDPQGFREWIAKGKSPDVHETKLNGRTVLELTLHEGSASAPETVTWWIDSVTYLPVQCVSKDAATTFQFDYGFLPPTPANIAQLRVTAPAGFTRTPGQKLP